MAPKQPDTTADMVITKCAKQVAQGALFLFLVLFAAHILLFYERKVV